MVRHYGEWRDVPETLSFALRVCRCVVNNARAYRFFD